MHDDQDKHFLAGWTEDRSNYTRWAEERGAADAADDAADDPWQDTDTGDAADDDPDGWDDEPAVY
ncbi:hypothetical protein ACWDD9_31760 [Kitasatospora sp. NPDC001119]